MEDKPAPLLGDMVINGFRWPPMACDDMPEELRKFKVRHDDVFIVTYPKSGTHWMTEIMKNIVCGGDLEKVKEYGHTIPLEFFNLFKKYDSFPTDKPRVMMTHVPVDILPKEVFEGKGKVVYVGRNPKDTAVSYWHFLKERRYLEEYEKWENFLAAFLKPDMMCGSCYGKIEIGFIIISVMCGSWFDINLKYYEHRDAKNFLFLTYEEIKLDHKGCVIQLCDFVSRHMTDEQVDLIVNNTTFSSMKSIFTGELPVDLNKQLENLPKLEAIGDPNQKFSVLRKGVVGDWKTQFTVAQNELFDEIYNEKMKGSSLRRRILF
ncbi:amine sulfotransferase-like [Anneissia japonica]|uniref:amine sulfotransferase-like n=1 Tax=Anneissia japonica TaxID=1529436 RepID=UPI00142583D5|nr:amine sulfotransferase-like [Anneissia japonica]